MPYNQTPLSRDEYLTLRNWIARGAPDKNGRLPFSEDADSRQKIYIANQANDMISVVDAARKVVMRNIPVGAQAAIESPHCVRVSSDGRYAYVCFLGGDYIQKIDTKSDQVVQQVQISNGSSQWNVLLLSSDGTRLLASDLARGWMRLINTANMQIVGSVGSDALPSSPFKSPHGMAARPAFDTIYMTGQYGNTVFKFTPDFRYWKYISIDGNPVNYNVGTRDPHEILLTPDGGKYFLTCEASAEVRVMDAHADTLMAVFPVPAKPQELAISQKKPYIFVTCMEATSTLSGAKGAVIVINYQTMQIVKTIYGPFWQPHGIAVDDVAGTFYVVSPNIGGPFSGHNHTNSSGKTGWYSVYDINTLELANDRQYELLSQPYSADSRMK
jgi:YVTN family beta-propeller protein